jgi:hypothetical protein
MAIKNPSSYVKAGAGRGAGTILPNTDLSGVLAREGQIMQQGAAKMQKMAQLQQEAKKIDDTKWDAIKPVIDKVWMEADGETYKVDRDKFQNYVVDVKNKYGMWNKVPYDEQQKILKMRDELRDYAALSGEQREIYKSQFLKYTADKNKYDPKTKDLLMDYYKGGGLKSQKERADYRAKLIQDNGGLLIPKEERFDWINKSSKSIGTILASTTGGTYQVGDQRYSFSKTATPVEKFISVADAVYINEPKTAESITKDLELASPIVRERFAYDVNSMPKEIQPYFEEGNPEKNYYLATMWNKKSRDKTTSSQITVGGGSSGGAGQSGLQIDDNPAVRNTKVSLGGQLIDKAIYLDKTVAFPDGGRNFVGAVTKAWNANTGKVEDKKIASVQGKLVEIVKIKGYNEWFAHIKQDVTKEALYLPFSQIKGKISNTKPYNKQFNDLYEELKAVMSGTATTATPTTTKPKSNPTPSGGKRPYNPPPRN